MKNENENGNRRKTCEVEFLSDFLPRQCWVTHESLQQKLSFTLLVLSCNFKNCVVFAIIIFPFLFLMSPRSLPLAMRHSITSWCPMKDAHHSGVQPLLSPSVISTRGSFSSTSTTDTLPLTTPWKGRLPTTAFQIDIDIWVCQKHFDNFNMTIERSNVKRRVFVVVCPVDIDLWMVFQERWHFRHTTISCCIQ